MIIPIKCFNCGCVLANKYQCFQERVRAKKIAQGQDPEKILYFTNHNKEKTAEGQVLDDLGLFHPCCRTKMLTHVDIS
jgi:DNA-directed RNA polymerase subunit N